MMPTVVAGMTLNGTPMSASRVSDRMLSTITTQLNVRGGEGRLGGVCTKNHKYVVQ